MEISGNKFILSIVFFAFLMLQPSCRVFKKDAGSSYNRTESNSTLTDKGKLIEQKNIDSNILESREINVKFFDQLPSTKRDPLNVSISSDFEIDIPDAAIDRLVERISELSIKVETRKTEHEVNSKIQENDLKESIALEEESNSKKVIKESDSTIVTNIPWYAWVIGAFLIFGIVWYLVKQVKPV